MKKKHLILPSSLAIVSVLPLALLACSNEKELINLENLKSLLESKRTTLLSGEEFSKVNVPTPSIFIPSVLGLEGFTIPAWANVKFTKMLDSKTVFYTIEDLDRPGSEVSFAVDFDYSVFDEVIFAKAEKFLNSSTITGLSWEAFYNASLLDVLMSESSYQLLGITAPFFLREFPDIKVFFTKHQNSQIVNYRIINQSSIEREVSFSVEFKNTSPVGEGEMKLNLLVTQLKSIHTTTISEQLFTNTIFDSAKNFDDVKVILGLQNISIPREIILKVSKSIGSTLTYQVKAPLLALQTFDVNFFNFASLTNETFEDTLLSSINQTNVSGLAFYENSLSKTPYDSPLVTNGLGLDLSSITLPTTQASLLVEKFSNSPQVVFHYQSVPEAIPRIFVVTISRSKYDQNMLATIKSFLILNNRTRLANFYEQEIKVSRLTLRQMHSILDLQSPWPNLNANAIVGVYKPAQSYIISYTIINGLFNENINFDVTFLVT